MSFAQMEGQCYKCGAKCHLSNTCTKNVTKGQWYMDKMNTDACQWGYNRALLMIRAWLWVLLPQPTAHIAKAAMRYCNIGCMSSKNEDCSTTDNNYFESYSFLYTKYFYCKRFCSCRVSLLVIVYQKRFFANGFFS